MSKAFNELDNQEDNKSINNKEKGEDSMSSVRRKYKRGKKEDSLVVSGNKFEKSEDIPNIIQKEEFIHYKKEVTKSIEDDYSSHEGESSLVKKSKEEKVIPGKIINLKKDIKDNNEQIVVEHSKIEKEIESSQNEIMKDLEKHLDLQDIKLSSNINSGNLNPNEVKEATYIKKTIEIITTSSDGKLIDDGKKDFNSLSKNEVVNNTTTTKTSLVNQIDESSKSEIKEKTENLENFSNNEEKTTKVTIIKEDNSKELLVNNNEKKEEKKEEIKEEKKEENKDIQAQKEIFSETKVIKTTEKTEKTEENVESELPKTKPEIEFKKDTKITTTTTTNLKTEPILPKQQIKQTEFNKLSEIISRSRQTKNEVINRRRQTPNQIIVRGRKTPNLMIDIGRQTPSNYLFSKTSTTTTTLTDNPITSILNKRNKEIYGNSSTTINKRIQHITSTLPQITETLGNRRQIGLNQTSSILTNMRKIEPYNFKKDRYDYNKITISNEKHLRNEKSTPALRGGVTKSITDFRKPLNTSSITSEILNNNLSTVSIFDTGKKKKREYILNVRKTDVIQPRNRIRLRYTNNPDKEFISTDFNLRSKIVRNLSKEHNNSSYLPNTVYHEINETKKHEKKEVQVAPRKFVVIKTKRKPYKYTYTISNTEQPLFRNSIRTSTITENDTSLLRGRNINPNPDILNRTSYQFSKSNYSTGLNLTSSHNFYNRTKYEPISHINKYGTNTTITTKISDVRNNRNKVSYVPLTAGNSKTNIFKATETKITNPNTNTNTNTRNRHRFNRIIRDSGNKNNLNSNKVIAIKTNKVIIDSGTKNDIDINKDITKDITKDINIEIKKEINKDITKDVNIEINKEINKDITKDVNIEINKEINKDIINKDNIKDINNAGYTKNEEKITKIVIEGASSSVQNSGSDALSLKVAKDVELVNKDENQVSLIKREVSSTITTKEITIESSIQKDGTETQFKQQSRFVRMEKKEE